MLREIVLLDETLVQADLKKRDYFLLSQIRIFLMRHKGERKELPRTIILNDLQILGPNTSTYNFSGEMLGLSFTTFLSQFL